MKNSFHVEEFEFNRLKGKERLLYILDRFYIGMEISVPKDLSVNAKDVGLKFGTIIGFNESGSANTPFQSNEYALNIYKLRQSGGDYLGYAKSVESRSIPRYNVSVKLEYEYKDLDFTSAYYPLWVYPDYSKVRNSKLESIGI